MTLFLIAFFLIYGGMHAYSFLKARSALLFGFGPGLALAIFMLVMVVSPLIVRTLELAEYDSAAVALAHVCYIWMGILFLFVVGSLTLDFIRLIDILVHSTAGGRSSSFLPYQRLFFYLPIAMALLVSLYGFFEAKNIRTERVTIMSKKIPKEIGRLRLVQISDVHLGLMVRGKRLDSILKVVRDESPDILISTGDLVDGMMAHVNGLSGKIAGISTKYGKYAVTGNHEFYAGIDHAAAFARKAGFRLLRGEAIDIGGFITVAGVDDSAGRAFKMAREITEEKLLTGLPENRFTILLKHRPDVDNGAADLFDLQLSGHTHKGQLFPFALIVRLFHPHLAGKYDLAGGAVLYVNRGTGTWGPPMRFLSPPEVTVIDLVHG